MAIQPVETGGGGVLENCGEMRSDTSELPNAHLVEIVSIRFLDSLGAISEPTSRRNVCHSNLVKIRPALNPPTHIYSLL